MLLCFLIFVSGFNRDLCRDSYSTMCTQKQAMRPSFCESGCLYGVLEMSGCWVGHVFVLSCVYIFQIQNEAIDA